MQTDLSLIDFGWGMVLPKLSFRKIANLLPHSLADAIPHTLIQAQHVRIHLLDLPSLFSIPRVHEHDERQNLLATVVGTYKRMRDDDLCVRQIR